MADRVHSHKNLCHKFTNAENLSMTAANSQVRVWTTDDPHGATRKISEDYQWYYGGQRVKKKIKFLTN